MLTRRSALTITTASIITPKISFAATPRELAWDDLIPEGVPYSEIIGDGERDDKTGTWTPVFDQNAIKLNEDLNGAFVKIPGYIVPLETISQGVKEFLLVPYLGACIHSPPPPANQLVFVSTPNPWPSENTWDPVWIYGVMRTQLQATELGQTGYSIVAETMEVYQW